MLLLLQELLEAAAEAAGEYADDERWVLTP